MSPVERGSGAEGHPCDRQTPRAGLHPGSLDVFSGCGGDFGSLYSFPTSECKVNQSIYRPSLCLYLLSNTAPENGIDVPIFLRVKRIFLQWLKG